MNNLQVFVRCYDKVSTGPKTRAGILLRPCPSKTSSRRLLDPQTRAAAVILVNKNDAGIFKCPLN